MASNGTSGEAAAVAAATHLQHPDAEATMKRNPHPDFKKVEQSRPDWDQEQSIEFVKTPAPDWRLGTGGNDDGASLKHQHVEIDPNADGRPAAYNYKLLISAITPRFIGFLSTLSADSKHANLAPYSYTTVVNHDPPIFVIGVSGGKAKAKDTLKNILDTKELVINVISEHFIEAANATSINAPFEISEWDVSGLHPAPSKLVRPARVQEAVFSVECKLVETREFESRSKPGQISGTLVIAEGIRFWAREDAINDDLNMVDPNVLKPMSRWGGITYSRATQAMELPRLDWTQSTSNGQLNGVLKEGEINLK